MVLSNSTMGVGEKRFLGLLYSLMKVLDLDDVTIARHFGLYGLDLWLFIFLGGLFLYRLGVLPMFLSFVSVQLADSGPTGPVVCFDILVD